MERTCNTKTTLVLDEEEVAALIASLSAAVSLEEPFPSILGFTPPCLRETSGNILKDLKD